SMETTSSPVILSLPREARRGPIGLWYDEDKEEHRSWHREQSLFRLVFIPLLWERYCSAVVSPSSAMPTLPSPVASSSQAMAQNHLSSSIWRRHTNVCIPARRSTFNGTPRCEPFIW